MTISQDRLQLLKKMFDMGMVSFSSGGIRFDEPKFKSFIKSKTTYQVSLSNEVNDEVVETFNQVIHSDQDLSTNNDILNKFCEEHGMEFGSIVELDEGEEGNNEGHSKNVMS